MPNWNSILFIYNPNAGRGQIRESLHDVISAFTMAGCRVTVYPTQAPGAAYRYVCNLAAEDAPRYDLLVAAGGDGTLHDVVAASMTLPAEKKAPIAYLPAGSTNDFAVSHTIPKAVDEAAHLALSGIPVPFDIGKFGDGYFSYIAAFGVFTDVSYDTPQDQKNRLGHFAYILEGARRLSSYKPYPLKVEIEAFENGQAVHEVIEGSFLLGAVMNTTSVGGFAVPQKDINLNDGLSELVLLRAVETASDLVPLLTALSAQKLDGVDGIVYRKVKKATFTFEDPVPWTLDGEYGGIYKEITTDTVHAGLEFLVPADWGKTKLDDALEEFKNEA